MHQPNLSVRLVAACYLISAAPFMSAQVADLPTPASYETSEGISFGQVQLSTDVEAGLGWTNNAWQDSSHEDAAQRILSISSSAQSISEERILAASFDFFGQDYVESEYSALDIETFSGTLFGQFQLSDTISWRGLLELEEDILGRSREDQINGIQAGTEVSAKIESALEWDNQSYFGSIMGRSIDLVSDSFDATEEGFEEESLDRRETDFIAFGGRHFQWGRAFAFAGMQEVDYESASHSLAINRDSDEYRYGLGAEFEHGKLSGDIDVYGFTQDFVSPLILDLENDVVGGISIVYAANDALSLTLEAERDFTETSIANSAGLFSDSLFAGLSFAPVRNTYVKLGPTRTQTQIANTGIEIDTQSLDLEASWAVSPKLKFFLRSSVAITESPGAYSFLDAQFATTYLSLSYSL